MPVRDRLRVTKYGKHFENARVTCFAYTFWLLRLQEESCIREILNLSMCAGSSTCCLSPGRYNNNISLHLNKKNLSWTTLFLFFLNLEFFFLCLKFTQSFTYIALSGGNSKFHSHGLFHRLCHRVVRYVTYDMWLVKHDFFFKCQKIYKKVPKNVNNWLKSA